jgi:hypothetical protein
VFQRRFDPAALRSLATSRRSGGGPRLAIGHGNPHTTDATLALRTGDARI